jgi:hypothetical protein
MRLLLFLGLSMFCLQAGGQVSNDLVENRLPLRLNEIRYSSTVDCTVEWKCLNQKLTSSCVKYHNDQWFYLVAGEEGTHYINLSNQECRDIWGVQVIIFSGEPCAPETYELITCYSDGTKDDIFISLPALEVGKMYLVNVDGYLNDQCVFGIEFSDQPRRFPLDTTDEAEGMLTMNLRQAVLEWEVSSSLAKELIHYEIWKNQGPGSVYDSISTIPHEINAFGEAKLSYRYIDSVRTSLVEYRIVGVTASDRFLIAQMKGKVDLERLEALPENTISLPLTYSKGEELAVLLYNTDADTVLFSYELTYDPQVNGWLRFNIRQFREMGIDRFKIVVIEKKTWARQEHMFDQSARKEE